MLGVISGSAIGMTSLVYYILVYMISNLAAFGVIAIIENRTGKITIDDYNGLYSTNPKLSIVMMLALFSLAGIPPFAGFFSKFFIFAAAAEQGFYVLVFIALLNTIISLYYYLLVVKAMFINKTEEAIAPFRPISIPSQPDCLHGRYSDIRPAQHSLRTHRYVQLRHNVLAYKVFDPAGALSAGLTQSPAANIGP